MNALGARATPSSHRRALRQALRLVLESDGELDDVDWQLTFQLAEAERIAALAWHRKGSVIRVRASAAVVDRWRAHAMRVALQVEGLIGAVSGAIAALESVGVNATVLKGPPLAQRLY